MKKIRFMLEYGCSPIWVYNNNSLIGVGLPEDLSDNELSALLDSISIEYDKLFINNSVEFTYKGFSCDIDEHLFDEKLRKAISLLKEKSKNQYLIEIDDSTFN